MPRTVTRPDAGTFFETPWAILPSVLARIVEWDQVRADAPVDVIGQLSGQHDGAVRAGSVVVIPVYGVIEHRSDFWMELLGGTSVEGIRSAIHDAMADATVSAVVLDVDSPGGSVAGVTELATEIRDARGGAKPIVAVANTLAASAAYWLASQADQVVVTPSGSVGAIGVYAVHQEASRLLDEMGITTTIVSAGPHKTEANEFEPLTDEARDSLQERVDATYRQFLADVGAGRRIDASQVEEQYGGGRVLDARKALAAGMVDRVETLSATVKRLGTVAGRRRAMAADSGAFELFASAIGRHTTPTSDDAWDGAAAEANLPSGDGAATALRKAHAWVDDDGDPDAKGSYKFIHHEVSSDGTVGAANLKACSSAIGILNGGRGGTTIPEADRSGVHRHLGGHLTDADRDVPPLTGQAPFTDRVAALAGEALDLAHAAEHRARSRAAAGRAAFSTTTERALRESRDAITALLDPGEPEPEGEPPEEPGEPEPTPEPTPPVVAATPTPIRRFRSRDDWQRYLEARNH